jgi:hypothetical protein
LNEVVQKKGFGALESFAVDSAANKARIGQAGGIECILMAMQKPRTAPTRRRRD